MTYYLVKQTAFLTLVFFFVFTLISCTQNKNEYDTQQPPTGKPSSSEHKLLSGKILINTRWQLHKLIGYEMSEQPEIAKIVLELQDNKAKGFSGCNSFQSQYSHDDDNISFFSFSSNMRECLDTDMVKLERHFLKALSDVDGFSKETGNLTLSSEGNNVIVMRAF